MRAQSIHELGFREVTAAPGFVPSATRQANRRRLKVFLGTLIVALIISLGFTFLRTAVYRASTRLEITPAAALPSSAPMTIGGPEPVKPFLTEIQVLTSRPVLEEVAQRLGQAGYRVRDFGPDPVVAMQSHIDAETVANTNVVELVANGERAALLAPLLNTIVDAYRDRLLDAYRATSGDAMTQADAEVSKLEAAVAGKRRDVESFRLRNDIVSLQRDENEVLARVKNQSVALGNANERVATAEGKLRALTDAQAAGNAVVRARDNPTLANLEQRASQAREDLRDLDRAYTPEYLAKDPKAIALNARLAELERQVIDQRRASQQAALADAQEELAAAQAAARRIEGQIAGDRKDVGQFMAHFNEYQAKQDDLAELEKVYRDAVQRRARLEASERARMPTIKVLETAATPREPWRPLYWRDAAIGIGGSLLLALLAMWLVELFNRSEPHPAVIVAQSLVPGMQFQVSPALSVAGAQTAVAMASPALLPQVPVVPREVDHDEVAVLLAASDEASRLGMLLLLSGISPEEAIALRGSDIDLARRSIHVPGAGARDITMSKPLYAILATRAADDLVLQANGHSISAETMDAQIVSAAHDARLARATEINASCLRHTYIIFLVRQGIRFSDLQRLVGGLPASLLGAYSALSPATSPVALDAIDPVFPAVRRAD